MNKFKRKSLYAAVLAGLGAIGTAGVANAVHVNPDGTGQVLLYPYYTVRSASTSIASGVYNTYVSVTNTTAVAKAVKVRFLEGKNSREVLDFNLFLSPFDVWTASVEPNTAGGVVFTSDKSCTTGVIGASGQPFSNAAYSAANADNETTSMDRTREGYIEIIEMGTILDGGAGSDSRALLTAITHVGGVPPCTATVLATADVAGLPLAVGLVGYLSAPGGGLMGSASLVNPSTGVDYTYDAVALNNWSLTTTGSASTSLFPSLGSGSVVTSEAFVAGAIRTATWAADLLPVTATANAKAVSAALMHDQVMNEYVLDAGTTSATDWVVTFPTKKLFVTLDPVVGGVRTHSATAAFPFNENFGLGGSCDTVGMTIYDREEQSTLVTGFSPAVTINNDLCWESNVITFNGNSILGSVNSYNTNTSYQNGWLNLGLNHGPYISGSNTILTAVNSSTNGVADATPNYRGLPVVGFMVQDFVNSTLVTGAGATPGAAFGGNFIHKYSRLIN